VREACSVSAFGLGNVRADASHYCGCDSLKVAGVALGIGVAGGIADMKNGGEEAPELSGSSVEL
jgi:hypothetical protein